MKRSIILFIFLLMLINTQAFAVQEVGGLTIDYPQLFVKDDNAENIWLSKIPSNLSQSIASLNIFVAPPINGLNEVRLLKVQYTEDINASVDGAVDETAKRIASLDGITNFKQQVDTLSVSGFDSRHASITADRRNGKIGVEILSIYDELNNILWSLQVTIGKGKSLNPFGSVKIDDERRYAKKILSSVSIDR
jgi:hypothetical protein